MAVPHHPPKTTTFLFHFRFVVAGPQFGPLVGQQGHQGLGYNEVRGGDQFVLFGYSSQKTWQEFSLHGIIHCR